MNNLPTAEEWINQQFEKQLINTNDIYASKDGVIEAMIIFAKLHCEAQLKAIIKNVKINEMKNYSCAMENMIVSDTSFSTENYEYYIDTNSIIKAYNLNNIK
jgi:hypothetical protein